MTIPQLKEKLDELGVVYGPKAGKEELEKLLKSVEEGPKGEAGEGDAPAEDDDSPEGIDAPADAPVAVKPAEAKVYNNSQFVRTYSKELHGEKYQELAEMFAKKKKGYTVR